MTTFGRPVWDLSDDRVSTAGPLVITNRGYLTREGEVRHLFPRTGTETSAEQKKWISGVVRKASAIEALSWGYLHRKVLRGSPSVY